MIPGGGPFGAIPVGAIPQAEARATPNPLPLLLEDPEAELGITVELHGVHRDTGAEVVWRVSDVDLVTEPTDTPASTEFIRALALSYHYRVSLYAGGQIAASSVPNFGDVTIANPMVTDGTGEPVIGIFEDADHLVHKLDFRNTVAEVKIGPRLGPFASYTTVYKLTAEDVLWSETEVTVKVADLQSLLDGPIQPRLFRGWGPALSRTDQGTSSAASQAESASTTFVFDIDESFGISALFSLPGLPPGTLPLWRKKGNVSDHSAGAFIGVKADGDVEVRLSDGTSSVLITETPANAVTDGKPHEAAFYWEKTSDLLYLYIDGALITSTSTAALTGSLVNTSNYGFLGNVNAQGAKLLELRHVVDVRALYGELPFDLQWVHDLFERDDFELEVDRWPKSTRLAQGIYTFETGSGAVVFNQSSHAAMRVLHFDGTAGQEAAVSSPTDARQNPNLELSVDCWLRLPSGAISGEILVASKEEAWRLTLSNTAFKLYVRDKNDAAGVYGQSFSRTWGGGTVPKLQPIHFGFRVTWDQDGEDYRAFGFENGRQAAQFTTSNPGGAGIEDGATAAIKIGPDVGGFTRLSGYFLRFRFWQEDVDLNAYYDQVLSGIEDGLVIDYDFEDQSSATNVHDRSQWGYDATISGAPVYRTTDLDLLAEGRWVGSGEGDPALKGFPMPVVTGRYREVEVRQVDGANLVFMVHFRGTEEISELRVAGQVWDLDTALGSAGILADIYSVDTSDITAGEWVMQLGDGIRPTYVRLGSAPSGKVTVRGRGDNQGADGYVETWAGIALLLLRDPDYLALEDPDQVDTGQFLLLASQDPSARQLTALEAVSGRQAMDELAKPDGWWSISRIGRVTIGRLALDGSQAQVLSYLDDCEEGSFHRQRSVPPSWRTRLAYAVNQTRQGRDVLDPSITESEKLDLELPFKLVKSAVEDQALRQRGGSDPLIETSYVLEDDAQVAADRRQALRGAVRDPVEVRVHNGLLQFTPGTQVILEWDRYGHATGKLYVCLGVDEGGSQDLKLRRSAKLLLWGGEEL